MTWPVLNRRPYGVLTAALLLCAGQAAAAAEPWDPATARLLAAWTWSPPQQVGLPGARMQIRHFSAPLDPADAARALVSAASFRFGRLQFSGSVLSLSGMRDGRHWLAQLRPAQGGTIGLLSSLGPAGESQAAARFDPAEFVPAGAQAVLRAASRLADGEGLLASYLCPGSHQQVVTAVERALRERHWRRLTDSGREWGRSDGARLTVHIHPHAHATALTFWHRSKESS